jgi:hypothetical protein
MANGSLLAGQTLDNRAIVSAIAWCISLCG